MQKLMRLGGMHAFKVATALLLVGYLPVVSAASVQTVVGASSYDINSNRLDNICTYGNPLYPQFAACHGTYAIPGSSSTLAYDANAAADYGSLRVFGESSISLTAAGSGGPEFIATIGIAQFRDQWTISGGAVGTTGTLELSFDITGSYDSTVDAIPDPGFSLYNHTNGTQVNDSQLPDYTGILSTDFIFGEELDFQVSLFSGSILYNLSMGGYDGQTSYLGMSAIMSAIVVKDSFGNVIPFSLSTASGAPLFNELATAVPIPAAIWLFGSGLLGLIGIARSKQSTSFRT